MSKTTKITARNIDSCNRNKGLTFMFVAVLGLSALGLASCGGGGSSTPAPPPVIDANPTGYYTGSADVKDGTGADQRLTDLQGMINGTRFMVMSAAGVPGVTGSIIYDGTITDINGNEFTADVTIYVTDSAGDNITVSKTTVSGAITEESKITGTFEGTSAWNGDFSLVYAKNNSEVSSVTKIETAIDEYWVGEITGSSLSYFTVDSLGEVTDIGPPGGGVFGGCAITNSSIMPIGNTRLYGVSFELSECSDSSVIASGYTGLATTKGTDDILVLIFSGNNLAASVEYDRSSR